jgi:multiple sugar transport system substrate-binding protein
VQLRRGRGRRARVAAVVAAAVLCLVSACTSDGASPSPTASESPSPSSSTEGPVTLRFAVYGTAQELAAYRAVASAYMQEKPEVTVDVEATGSRSAAEAKLDKQFVAGTAPDLFLTDATALPSLVADSRVQPVDELLEERDVQFGDNYERLGLEAFAAEDKLQCMPTDVSPYVVFYNRRLLGATPLSTSVDRPLEPARGWWWGTFVEAARQMTDPSVKGVYLAPDLTTLTALLRSAGSDVVDDPHEPTTLQLADGPTRSALERILTVARDEQITPTPEQLRAQGALARFKAGRLGMMFGTKALVPQLRAIPGLRFDVAPLPVLGRAQTIAEVSGYCLSAESQHTSAAADFLKFAIGDRAAELTAASGGSVPANLAALHSESFVQTGQFPLHEDVFTNVMRRADTMPNPLAWPEVVARTQPLLDRLFYAPVLDLDVLLPRIDSVSESLLQQPTPSSSPSESSSPSG